MKRRTPLLLSCGTLLTLAVFILRAPLTHSETVPLRRLTATPPHTLNINPTISGDGSSVLFESTADAYDSSGTSGFRLLLADTNTNGVRFVAATRAPAPALSNDGHIITFASADDPLGTNPDHNSEIFIYANGTLRQLTATAPRDATTRSADGNFSPSISDDGRFIAFSSNRNITGRNTDSNAEIILYDSAANTFTQLTDSSGITGATDAKLSGDASHIAFTLHTAAAADLDANSRSLVLYDRAANQTRTLVADLPNLSMTYGRAISDAGTRIVFAADTAPNSSQVFVFDARLDAVRQITRLSARSDDVPLHPTISGDGSRLAFSTRRTVADFANPDRSVELYSFDIPLAQFTRVTDLPTNSVAEIVSSMNDDGSLVAFNFPRALTAPPANAEFAANSEIYLASLSPRPAPSTDSTIFNAASLDHAPPPANTIAPASLAVIRGRNVATATIRATLRPDAPPPTELGGTTLTVANRPAGLLYVSPTEINFLVPADAPHGAAQLVVTNADGLQTHGAAVITQTAPGIFTTSGDGQGEAVALDARTLLAAPFDPLASSIEARRILLFTTGVRGAGQVTATLDDATIPIERITPVPSQPGIDQVELALPRTLANRGRIPLRLTADGRDSNATFLRIAGLLINEVLADPPDDATGDANRDGVRSASDDEFIELVNSSSADLRADGYTLLTRDASGADALRHTFITGTIIPAGASIVVFGGANEATFDPGHASFGGAQVALASSGGLGLLNNGSVVTLRDAAGRTIDEFTYGNAGGASGSQNQSITRSPDIRGAFSLHTAANNPRPYSPGTRTDGAPFSPVPRAARITLEPSTASLLPGASAQFTARAFDTDNAELSGVIFAWETSDPRLARVDANGIVTAVAPGSVTITAIARGVRSAPATLTINAPQPTILRVEVTPTTAAINRGGAMTFVARAFDRNGAEASGAPFTFTSVNPLIAAIEGATSRGVVRGVGIGRATIRATTSDGAGGAISGEATIDVRVPLVINEILADVPPDNSATPHIEGDANRDGVRDGADDEFVELVNASTAPLDISGIRMSDLTGNRFTFPANTMLAAGQAAVVFGGGAPSPDDPAFGGARIFAASALGLNDTGDTVTLRLRLGTDDILIAAQAFPSGDDVPAPSNQSLTRVPDAAQATPVNSFIAHTAAVNAATRVFSPGTRTDGTPFNSAALTRIEVTPAAVELAPGESQTFTARAVAIVDNVEVEVPRTSFIWETSDATGFSLTPLTGTMTRVTVLRAGVFELRARAGGRSISATLTSKIPVKSIALTPAAATITEGETTTFAATARDANGAIIPNISFAFSLRNAAPPDAAVITTTTAATVTVRGARAGSTEIIARTDGLTSNAATLTVKPLPPRIMRVEISPSSAAINRGGTQVFTARAFDENNREATEAAFAFTSGDAGIAAVAANGTARGVGIGAVKITAATSDNRGGTVTGAASLTIRIPIVINEFLADVPPDDAATEAIEGDANQDGVRDSDNDEFIELLNTSSEPVDISGVLLADATATRFTVPPNTTLPAGGALVVFGGGTPSPDAGVFGGAQVLTTNSLSLNDGGDTIRLSLPLGATESIIIIEQTYGTNGAPPAAAQDQSLARSPDAAINFSGGAFIPHKTATNAAARAFSPGARTDGTPFGSPAVTRIEVTPATTEFETGEVRRFTARAFGTVNGVEVEIPNVSFIWEASAANRISLRPLIGAETNATGVTRGTVELSARAGGARGVATLTIKPVVASVELTPAAVSIVEGEEATFRATARDANGSEVPNIVFVFALRDASPADAARIVAATAEAVTVRGVKAGGTSVVASFKRPRDGVTLEDSSSLTIAEAPRVTRIEVQPTQASILVGATQQFTARAFDQRGAEFPNAPFAWRSNDERIALINSGGLAMGIAVGSAQITASVGSVTSQAATLAVSAPPPRIVRVELTPASAVVNRGGAREFRARAFDEDNREAIDAAFAFTSTDALIASVDASGTARGIAHGAVKISAETNDNRGGVVRGEATLIVRVPLVINEILADVPPDDATTPAIEGDANRDGVRNSDDDEFIELINASSEPVDISGTRIFDGTNLRFTFPPNASLASGQAAIVFGGGAPPSNEPAFGGALIFTTNSLGLNDAGDTVTLKLPLRDGEIILATLTYPTANAPAPADQSLTRSPDATETATGDLFVAHTTATNAHNRRFSPGTRADGTPFGSRSITRIEITPATAEFNTDATMPFTARAFGISNGVEAEVSNVSFIWEASAASRVAIAPQTGAAVSVTGIESGVVELRARAGGVSGSASLNIKPVVHTIELAPVSGSIFVGGQQQFTARALDRRGAEISGVQFAWRSSDEQTASVNVDGLAIGLRAGATQITAEAGGVTSNAATLIVNEPPPRIVRVDVSPASATINRGNTQAFTASAFDENNQEKPDAAFTFTSTDALIATIDSNGLARGVGFGEVVIRAAASDNRGGTVTGEARLTIRIPLVINELLADVPPDDAATPDVEGDANRDGVRSSGDDEFVELVNASAQSLDISGVQLADASSARFTFPANTLLASGQAALVFGGGAPPVDAIEFGGALVFKASALSLNDAGDTVNLRLPPGGSEVLIAQQSYGMGGAPPAAQDQSLTRFPDAATNSTGGDFIPHTTATNADARTYSPGARTDGTPFGSPPVTRIEVMPASATVNVGETQTFTARAFARLTDNSEVEVSSVSFIWDAGGNSAPAPRTGRTTNITGSEAGIFTISARAGGQTGSATLDVKAVIARIELAPESASVATGESVTFTATARDANGNAIAGVSFEFSLRDSAPQDAARITAQTTNTVTVRGDAQGSAVIVTRHTRASDGTVFEDTSALTITAPVAPRLPVAGEVIINEALVAFAASTTETRADFLELYNVTDSPLDISGLVISFRPGGSANAARTVTLPGAIGGGQTVIEPRGYFVIANGASVFGETRVYDASATGFDLNNTTGGIKIEINSLKLDGLTYQGGSAAPAAEFATYGEGTIFTFTGGTTNDLTRQPNGADTNANAADFRRNGTTANVSPRRANPATP